MTDHAPDQSVSELLEIVGRALFGKYWAAPLAQELGVAPVTVQRWRNGRTPFPLDHGAWKDILILLRAKADSCAEAEAKIAERIKND